MEISKAKEQTIKAGIELVSSGLIARTWGNVSCRTDENHFVITASGRNYLTLTPEEVIEVDIENLAYDSDIKPSSEKKVHREIYRLKKEANFVIHTHQSNASAVAAMGLKGIKLDREYPGIGNFVLCAEYGLPGSKKLCRNTAETVSEYDGQAVLMANHGAVCYGSSYEEAFRIAHDLEEACGRYLESIGVPPCKEQSISGSKNDEHAEGTHAEQACKAEDICPELCSAENIIWNSSPAVMKFMEARDVLKPYLDDFAQLAGTGLKVIENNEKAVKKAIKYISPVLVRGKGALCIAEDRSDAEALSMVIEKNCRAALAALGAEPIASWECVLMRQFYLRKYSKRNK